MVLAPRQKIHLVRDRAVFLKYFPSFGRYSLVGAVATTVHYLALVALVERAGLAPPLAAMIGAMLGMATAYTGNYRYTFASDVAHQRALPRFATVAAAGAIANGCIVWAGTVPLGLHYLVAQFAATVLVLTAGFSLNRNWTFA